MSDKDTRPKVYGRKGTDFARRYGRMTGGWRFCRLEGCTGRRLGVRWSDGHVTWPCSKGLGPGPEPGSYRIL